MKDSIIKKRIINYSLATSAILLIILIWAVLSTYYQNEMIFPNIKQIFNAFIDIFKDSSNINAILMTFIRVITTVLICLIISLLVVGLYILLPNSIYFFKPLIQIMRSTPLAVISIFIFILIGDKVGPFVITILMSLPITIEGLITSVDEIHTDLIDEVKTLQGSTIIKIKDVYIPIILPFIIMTLIQTLGMSFKVMIMGEYICQTNNSIGKILYGIKANLEMDSLIAYGILIVLIVSIIELIIKQIKKSLNK